MQAYIAKVENISDAHWNNGLATAIFFSGCDFRCPICNTPDMFYTKEEHILELREIKKIIKDNQTLVKAVVFTGGEPCLQRQSVLTLATYAKDLGLRTGLETNGSKTETLRSLLNLDLIDFLAFDLKAPLEAEFFERATKSKTFFKTTESLIKDVENSLVLLKKYEDRVDIEFRSTITPSLLNRKEDLFKIAEKIEHLRCSWLLQFFKTDNVGTRFKDLRPPTGQFLNHLRDALSKRYPKIRVVVDSEPF